MTRLGQITWNVPIVDSAGRPTAEFLRKWNAQNSINGSIPSLSTVAEVSTVLDQITATQGALLLRGAALWAGLSSPADPKKFLSGANPPVYAQVKDADLAVTDVTTNNASTDAHGFLPKLSGTATTYLDGTGAFSTPAGGGGSGVADPLYLPPPFDPVQTSSAGGSNAFVGRCYVATQDSTLTGLRTWLKAFTGTSVRAAVYAATSTGLLSGATLVAEGNTTSALLSQVTSMPFSAPVSLLKDHVYWAGMHFVGSGTFQTALFESSPGEYFTLTAASLPTTAPTSTGYSGNNFAVWGY